MRIGFWNRIDEELAAASREARNGVKGLGPGIITGVADDDPSGISTYTVVGASYGYQLLWTSPLTLPLNIAVQDICARIGVVTGNGLSAVIARRYGRSLLFPIVFLLLVANIVNIGADVRAIAAAIDLLTGIPSLLLVAPVGVAIALVEVVVPYPRLARYLKLLTLVVFAYVVGAFFANPDWGAAARATVLPEFHLDAGVLAALVAILGTTISPYLFFWQTSEEVEEEEERGLRPEELPAGELRRLLHAARLDVATGMVMANVGFYFVVLTAAAALHASGQTDVTSAADAAAALEPLAGSAAKFLFAVGIIGTGLLAIPVLAGSSAYAAAELFGWREGLSSTLRQAPQFYAVIALATFLGIGMSFAGVSEIQALYFAAIVNGLIAPVSLVVIMLAAHDPEVLGEHRPGVVVLALGWLTAALMGFAALGLGVAAI